MPPRWNGTNTAPPVAGETTPILSVGETSTEHSRYNGGSDTDGGRLTQLSIDDAIEQLGYGPFQIRIMIAAGLCFAADAMEILLLSFLSVVLQLEWKLSSQETATITSSVFSGAMVGTLVLGPLADRIGRRPVFILAATLISLFGILTAFSSTLVQMCSVRFICGFGIGGLTVPFDTLAEMLPNAKRGTNLLYIEYFWTAGTLLVPVAAFWTLRYSSSNWPSFCILCSIPCLISATMALWLVPESPRWLIEVGRDEEAKLILQRAAVLNGLDATMFASPTTRLVTTYGAETETTTNFSVFDLFSPNWREVTLRLWVAWFGFAILYYGAILAITLVFSTNESGTNDQETFDYIALFLSCSAEFFGTTFAIIGVDRIGRTPLQSISFLMGGVSVMLLLVLPACATTSRFFLIGLSFSARFFLMSGSCTTWVATAELLPTQIRTTGHACANAMARLGGLVVPYLVQEATPIVGLLLFGIAIISHCAVSRLPETTGKVMGFQTKFEMQETS